jgi:hypothetical protein
LQPPRTQAGEWKIHVTYDGEDIENSPFKCMVFDPRAISVRISIRTSLILTFRIYNECSHDDICTDDDDEDNDKDND